MERQTRGVRNQQVGCAGELFVAAELNKRGATATLYLTNTPRVDVVATDPEQRKTVHIQVKSSRSKRWHGNIEKLRDESKEARESDFLVFVDLGGEKEAPTYYVCPLLKFAAELCQGYDQWVKSRGGKRPRSPESTHILVTVDHVEPWRERWDLLGIFG